MPLWVKSKRIEFPRQTCHAMFATALLQNSVDRAANHGTLPVGCESVQELLDFTKIVITHNERVVKLDRRQYEVHAKEEDMAHALVVLNAMNKDLEEREAAFAKREAAFAEREAAFAERQRVAEEIKGEMEKRKAALEEMQDIVYSHKSDVTASEDHLTERERDLAERECNLADRERELAEREKNVDDHEIEVHNWDQSLDIREKELEHHEELAQQKEFETAKEIERFHKAKELFSRDRASLEDDRRNILMGIKDLRDKLREREDKIIEREEKLAKDEADVRSRTKAIDSYIKGKDVDLHKMRQDCFNLRRKLDVERAELDVQRKEAELEEAKKQAELDAGCQKLLERVSLFQQHVANQTKLFTETFDPELRTLQGVGTTDEIAARFIFNRAMFDNPVVMSEAMGVDMQTEEGIAEAHNDLRKAKEVVVKQLTQSIRAGVVMGATPATSGTNDGTKAMLPADTAGSTRSSESTISRRKRQRKAQLGQHHSTPNTTPAIRDSTGANTCLCSKCVPPGSAFFVTANVPDASLEGEKPWMQL